MGGEVLGEREQFDAVGDLEQRLARVVDDVDGAHEGPDGQPGAVAGAAGGREHVRGARRVVAQRDGRVVAHEDRAGVADPGRHGGGVGGLDLEVLRGIGVGHCDGLVEVADQHDRGLLPREGGGDALGVPCGGHLGGHLLLHARSEVLRRGDEHGGGERVVLGLRDQVGRDVPGVGGGVGDDRDLGGTRLSVDAHEPADETLGGDDVDVARTGDEVDRLAEIRDAVGEHGDRLGAADGVHLVHAEQVAQSQDAGVRQPTEVLLRRGGDRDGCDARDLRGDDVHDDAGRQRREAPGDVQADTTHRHVPQPDAGAVGHLGRRGIGVSFQRLGDGAATPDRLGERLRELRIELTGTPGEHVRGHAERGRHNSVEAMRVLGQGLGSPGGDVVDDGADPVQGRLHVELTTGQQGAVGAIDAGQIESTEHAPDSSRTATRWPDRAHRAAPARRLRAA